MDTAVVSNGPEAHLTDGSLINIENWRNGNLQAKLEALGEILCYFYICKKKISHRLHH
jgi:hypothetical protein